MDKQHFDQLVKGVRQMKRHIAGKVVRGAKNTELLTPDVHVRTDVRSATKERQGLDVNNFGSYSIMC